MKTRLYFSLNMNLNVNLFATMITFVLLAGELVTNVGACQQ